MIGVKEFMCSKDFLRLDARDVFHHLGKFSRAVLVKIGILFIYFFFLTLSLGRYFEVISLCNVSHTPKKLD